MNDRFKFRVWDKQNECYAYSNNSDVDMLYIETDGVLTYGIWNEDYEDMFYTPESEVVIEQCTGIKDRNGELIYENDLIKIDDDVAVINWSDYYARFMLESSEDIFDFERSYAEECEVIGNIHENPDLLENEE